MNIVKAVQYSTIQGAARYVAAIRRVAAGHFWASRRSAAYRASFREFIHYAKTLTDTTATPMSAEAKLMDPSDPVSAALEICRKQLCACASYQAFVGCSGDGAAASAVEKTYLASLPAPTNGVEYTPTEWETALRPFGMVYTSTMGGNRTTRSALYGVEEKGRIFIELEIAIPTAYQPDPNAPAIDLTQDLKSAARWILNQETRSFGILWT